MPLQPTTQNRVRHQQKIQSVLRFLRTSIYSTAPLLGAVMNIPDPLAVNPQSLKVAIECELSLKAPIRYKRDVIPNHIRQLNAQQYDFVLWLAPTFDDQQTLHQSLRNAMAELQNENKIHIQRTYDNYRMFQFANLQTWPHV